MRQVSNFMFAALLVFGGTACVGAPDTQAQEKSPEAIALSKEQLSGEILEGRPIVEFHGNQAQFAGAFRSEDGKLAFGAFAWTVTSAETAVIEFENYPIDEGMFFLEGGMKVVDTNGKVTEAGVGEFLFIPKGWSGTHYVQDMRKVSIRYGETVAKEVNK